MSRSLTRLTGTLSSRGFDEDSSAASVVSAVSFAYPVPSATPSAAIMGCPGPNANQLAGRFCFGSTGLPDDVTCIVVQQRARPDDCNARISPDRRSKSILYRAVMSFRSKKSCYNSNGVNGASCGALQRRVCFPRESFRPAPKPWSGSRTHVIYWRRRESDTVLRDVGKGPARR